MRGGGPRGRGGGDRGDQRPPFGHGDGEGGGRSSSFVWPPPATTPHQVSCGAPATPQVSFSPAPPAAQVTMRAPPSSASPAPSSSAPSPLARSSSAEKTMAPPAAAAASDAEADVDLAPVCKKGLAHPARPGLGTVGKSLMMCANHFLVVVADDNLFRNDVSINPESKLRATNREVLNELIKFHGRTALSGKLPAYDGRKSLCTAGAVPFESEEFVVTLVEPEKEQKESVENENTITIRIAGRTDRHQLLRGKQRDMPQETIQVLDVVHRQSPSWNYVTVSRPFSLRPTQMDLSLNIDIPATSFFKPLTVIKFVELFLNICDTAQPLLDRGRVKINKALHGVRIETSHQPDQIRRYKITGIAPFPMSQLIFPIDDKRTRQTVVQYFWDKHNYKLNYGSWPCLQAGSDSCLVYLRMEVCKIEGQRFSKKLNDRKVTNILKATCKRTQERKLSILDAGGHTTVLERAFVRNGIPYVSEVPTIIFGADVTLPPPGEYSASSIAAVLASMDWPEITKYRGLVSAQPHRQEIIEDLSTVSKNPQKGHNVNGGMMRELLIAFRSTNRRPARVIAYRDGASEDQFSHVLLHEMDAIRKACASLEEGYLPSVTFMVVQKRHHSRLFHEVHGRRDVNHQSGNILPGMVVDHNIFHPSGLISIYAVMLVFSWQAHFTADSLQSLTNNLCYTYAHCIPAVSVVPPAYCAHLDPFRTRYYVEEKIPDGGPTPRSSLVSIASEGSQEQILIDVHMSGSKVQVLADKFSRLDYVISKAIEPRKVSQLDAFFKVNGRTASPETLLSKSCNLYLQDRVRAGSPPNASIKTSQKGDTGHLVSLRSLITQLIEEQRWFEVVQIPLDLQLSKTYNGVSELLALRDDGACWVIGMLLDALEFKHELGLSFNGSFTIDDIWYNEYSKRIEINAKWEDIPLTQEAYMSDLAVVVLVLQQYFQYVGSSPLSKFPMFVGELITVIMALKLSGDEYLSKNKRSLIFNHPCSWTASGRIKIFDSLMNYYHKSPPADKKLFSKALRVGRPLYWDEAIPGGQNEMGIVLCYRTYDDDYYGRLDFTRCFITHVNGATGKQADAAVYVLAPKQLSELQWLLLVNYPAAQAAATPAAGSGSHARTSTSRAGSGSHARTSTSRAGSGSHARTSTSSSSSSISSSSIAAAGPIILSSSLAVASDNVELHQIFTTRPQSVFRFKRPRKSRHS